MAILRRQIFAALAVALLTNCAFVKIEGDGNSVSDTGGDGGGVSLPPTPKQAASNDIHHKPSDQR
ncbi:hypothetical protein ACAX43_16030 [Paraburkholderia sp. IW21]|uniref:hypothetical protein n=1 Tax=Paraburkholderia sp. IW21 TaxID=3242488 RepID=UPI0035220E1B